MRRTLASPIFAISSNSPSAIFAEALSASMRTARRGERGSEGMTYPQDGDETCQDWEAEATFFDWRKHHSEADTIRRISQLADHHTANEWCPSSSAVARHFELR